MIGRAFGRYRLLDMVGRGGMGEVWRAFDTATERTVAIKVLSPHLARDNTFRERFQREARSAASLSEPHIVPIYDFGEIAGSMYVSMQLVDGKDLQALLAYGPLEPSRAVGIIEQIAVALHAAHRIGLVHRDVKPSNILVTEDDFAYLIDFGIARAAGETAMTSTGATIGSLEYMAPERFNSGTADARSDIYALSCVLYQALTGKLPFPATGLEHLIHAHLFTPPPRPSESNPYVPRGLDQVVEIGMAKDPGYRYAAAGELAQAARAALDESRYQAWPPSVAPYPITDATQLHRVDTQPPRKWSRRNRIALSAVCTVILVGVAAILVAVHRSPDDHYTPTARPGPTAVTTTRQTKPPVPPLTGAVGGLLLNFPDLGNALHEPNAMPSNAFDPIPGRVSDKVSPRPCAAIFRPAQTAVYEGSGASGLYPWDFTDGSPRSTALRWGNQTLVQFSTAKQAAAFFEKSTELWSSCGRHFTNQDEAYDVGPLSESDRMLSVKFTAPAVSCGRALTVRNNIVVEVMVCNKLMADDEPAAIRVAELIAADIRE